MTFILLTIAAALAAAKTASGGGAPRFRQDVRPILRACCLKCHGDAEPKGGLDVRTRQAMLNNRRRRARRR